MHNNTRNPLTVCKQILDGIVSSIWPIDRTLSSATISGQSGFGNNGNEGVLHIPQISKTGASSSEGLISYQDTRWKLEGLTPSEEMQLVYSNATANWAVFLNYMISGMNTSCGVMANKLNWQTIVNKFNSYCVSHTSGLVQQLSST